MAECVDYTEHLSSQKTKSAVTEYKVEIAHDGTVVSQQPPTLHFTLGGEEITTQKTDLVSLHFSREQIAEQKTDLVSALGRPSKHSEPSQDVDKSADHAIQRDKALGKTTVDQSDFHNRRKHRLSVRYLPNVQQIIQRYEKTDNAPPSVSSTAPVKNSVRCQANESSESLVARQAARYMNLDRSARLEFHFEHRQQGSNSRTCESFRQTEQREHPLLSSSSSNSSIISSASVCVGAVDISPIESACDLQSNSCRVTTGWPWSDHRIG